ncbi:MULTISPECIES: hypothetical protein [unclassified Paenibacillus]|uniref:hypothetical protein n=1 Tax=unclassified Paenibacillus TaxID=185978 RepID=UPI0002F5751F|nr:MULTISPECIES: hypothetical protein [unclassified Paenibacillus]MCM3341778.1 hypothetical protein [Paenibacillus sp. MER TA 81-3]
MTFSKGRQKKCNDKNKNNKKKSSTPKLTVDQIAVIAALLTNSLKVQSILVDRDQAVEVLLIGSLRKKTQMDQLVEQISDLSIGDFLDSLNNLKK